MLKEQAKLLNNINKVVDLLVTFVAFIVAYCWQEGWYSFDKFDNYLWIMLIILPSWYFLFNRFGLYASQRTSGPIFIVISLLKAHIIGGLIVSSLIFNFGSKDIERVFFGIFLLCSFVMLGIERLLLRAFLGVLRSRGFNFRNILVVGTTGKAAEFIRVIEQHQDWGLRIIGVLSIAGETSDAGFGKYPILGSLPHLVDICKANPVDEVVFCLPRESLLTVDEHIYDMKELGVTVRMVLDIYDVDRTRRELSTFHGEIPILTFYSKAFDAQQLFLKRCLDIFGAVVGLLLTAVLLPFIALAIRLDSPGSVFFGQERVGVGGRTFRCWKFRSMYRGADARKKELLDRNEMNGAIFKMKGDPRITRVGKWLRKMSLDELPQFWNVLRGEMSLVGTRPPTPDEVRQYENWHRRRISIKPGITGLWQVSGRNQVSDFDDVVRLDLQYIDQWSLGLDLKVLMKTPVVVFSRKGAE